MEPARKRSSERQLHNLVPSVITFALMLLIVVLLFEYTNIFDSWLAWVIVPVIVALAGFDFWLRVRTTARDE